jgi:hypothetical protein
MSRNANSGAVFLELQVFFDRFATFFHREGTAVFIGEKALSRIKPAGQQKGHAAEAHGMHAEDMAMTLSDREEGALHGRGQAVGNRANPHGDWVRAECGV